MASSFSNQSYFSILSNFSKINQSFFENLPVLPYRCSKINPSFFTIKEGSTSHLGLLPSGKKRKPLLPVALNRCAIRLAGHQSPRQGCFSGDEPAGRRLAKMVVRDGTVGGDLLKPMVIRDGTAGTR